MQLGQLQGRRNFFIDYKFTIVATTTTDYVISVLAFPSGDPRNASLVEIAAIPATPDSGTRGTTFVSGMPAIPAVKLYFLLPKTNFEDSADKLAPGRSITLTTPIIPVKLGFGNKGTGETAGVFCIYRQC